MVAAPGDSASIEDMKQPRFEALFLLAIHGHGLVSITVLFAKRILPVDMEAMGRLSCIGITL